MMMKLYYGLPGYIEKYTKIPKNLDTQYKQMTNQLVKTMICAQNHSDLTQNNNGTLLLAVIDKKRKCHDS